MHHRHAFNAVLNEQAGDRASIGVVADGDDRARHDVARAADRRGWLRPMMSPSLTMPTGAPPASTIGSALIWCSSSKRAISVAGASGEAVTTALVMISRANRTGIAESLQADGNS
ncbi:MAG: hypothetical protein ABSG66_07880 [Stellaceae bacterium]